MFPLKRLHVIFLLSSLMAVIILWNAAQPTFSAQRLVSPQVKIEALSVSVDDLFQIAISEARIQGLVGAPTAQVEYFLTQGQWLTVNGLNTTEEFLPDRATPIYVLRISGDFNFVSHTGVTADMAEIAVHVSERRILSSGLKSSQHIPAINVDVIDAGYPSALPPEIIEAHQFGNTPVPDDDEADALPIPEER